MFTKFIRAVITRALFILVSLIGVWRVISVKKDEHYWLLIILNLPLVVELILTLMRRKGEDYKWFSPAIFLFLISIIPTIWILEIHHQQNKSESQCDKLDSSDNVRAFFSHWMKSNASTNTSEASEFLRNLSSVCANEWILALHQILLILLIVGRWLIPIGSGVTRDELSQLLLTFVGTAADILEFTSETLSDVKDNSPQLVYIVLAIWTWSMLQFPFQLSVVNSRAEDESDAQGDSPLIKHRTDVWAAMETIFIQDGPFLVFRLTVMTHYDIIHQMLVFFAIKNFLVVALNVYRMWVIFQDYRSI